MIEVQNNFAYYNSKFPSNDTIIHDLKIIRCFAQQINCKGSVHTATQIEKIVLNSKLTDCERRKKLEQMADNEIRKIIEINRLEDEEKELFGFDLSEFNTTHEIRQAENPWLTQRTIQSLVTNYLNERLGSGLYKPIKLEIWRNTTYTHYIATIGMFERRLKTC